MKTKLQALIWNYPGCQHELAAQLRVSPSLISHVKVGRRRPSLDLLKRASVALGMTIDELMQPSETAEVAQGE